MVKKYICEVKRDQKNNELELVNTNNYETVPSSATEGAIQFSNSHEMNRYFNQYCISEDQLKNNSNSLFMFLFFLLLLIFLVTLICQMFNKSSGTRVSSIVGKTSFGRFSF
uniref:Uncharacterized protein n=1 Tax=viral metagenome TaxID=1070528 RepID=A0A6C0LEN0_9ZZZZ